MDTSFLPEENKVLELLADAWNIFSNLEVLHPSDGSEFLFAIHLAERVIISRPFRKEYLNKSSIINNEK